MLIDMFLIFRHVSIRMYGEGGTEGVVLEAVGLC